MSDLDFLQIFKDCRIQGAKVVVKSDIASVIRTVKQKYGFDILKEIAAVDKKEQGIELNYRLYSTENDEEVVLTAYTDDRITSVSEIYDSSVADEREIYDLFGIKFDGNNELKRLYMPEGFEGYPMKKDYVMKDERLGWND